MRPLTTLFSVSLLALSGYTCANDDFLSCFITINSALNNEEKFIETSRKFYDGNTEIINCANIIRETLGSSAGIDNVTKFPSVKDIASLTPSSNSGSAKYAYVEFNSLVSLMERNAALKPATLPINNDAVNSFSSLLENSYFNGRAIPLLSKSGGSSSCGVDKHKWYANVDLYIEEPKLNHVISKGVKEPVAVFSTANAYYDIHIKFVYEPSDDSLVFCKKIDKKTVERNYRTELGESLIISSLDYTGTKLNNPYGSFEAYQPKATLSLFTFVEPSIDGIDEDIQSISDSIAKQMEKDILDSVTSSMFAWLSGGEKKIKSTGERLTTELFGSNNSFDLNSYPDGKVTRLFYEFFKDFEKNLYFTYNINARHKINSYNHNIGGIPTSRNNDSNMFLSRSGVLPNLVKDRYIQQIITQSVALSGNSNGGEGDYYTLLNKSNGIKSAVISSMH